MRWQGGSAFAGLVILAMLIAPALRGEISEAFLETHTKRLEVLISRLDTDIPSVAAIHSLWKAGDHTDATSALCAYYRKKDFPLQVLDEPLIPANFMEQAEAAIQGKFFLLNEWEQASRAPEGGIDWESRGSSDDKERAWMLNRHASLICLAEAYRQSGEERYRDALNDLWTDWILSNPYPDRLSFSAPWRALEVARRILNSWVYLFYGYDVLNDETRLLILSSVLDHADAFLEHTSFWGGNHLITEKLALLATATAFPEFKKSDHWRDDAIEVISNEFISQTYPDGSYRELSNHYQRVVLTNTTKFLKLLKAVGRSGEHEAVAQRIEQMWDFFAGVMRPDGFGPLNNAADTEHNAAHLIEVWERFNRPDWLYRATNGEKGTKPLDKPSHLYEWAGQAILRTGWERDASWVYFDAGPYGTAHQHIDRFHVSAALGGRPVLVDNGRYIYQPGPWKDYFQGPASHNILLLDGQPAEQAPREIKRPLESVFEQTDTAAFAAAKAHFTSGTRVPVFPNLYSTTAWTRAVLLDKKGRFVLILDHLLSFRSQRWTAQWHFDPDISVEEAERALTLISPSDAVLSIVRIGSGPPDIAGFHSPEYNLKQPAVQVDFSGKLDGPATLVWLLQSPDTQDIHVDLLSKPGDPIQHLQISEDGVPVATARLQVHPVPALIAFETF